MSSWRAAPELAAALEQLDSGATRAAHEAFEDVWRANRATALGEVARALSQWAAACIHLDAGRETGFQSIAAKCAERLSAERVADELDTMALANWITEAARDPRARPLRPIGG